MKILMVSMFSPHFFNWTEQLKDSGHEVYWLDVFDSNTQVQKIDFVDQIIGWRYRWDYPGRHFLKKRNPKITKLINRWNERKLTDVLEEKIKEIKPDVVHSFILQSAGFPILSTMKKYPNLKWIYSSWGSDLYFRQQFREEREKIIRTLQRVNYMFSDCNRDYQIALKHGFRGEFLGVFPGGGGFDLEDYSNYFTEIKERKLLLIKGYEGNLGRCSRVLEALTRIKEILNGYDIVVFGNSKELDELNLKLGLDKWGNFKMTGFINHNEVLKLMGKAQIYLGNSISDGMPNTLLEAIIMEVFPIQSNPGGATAEIIEHGKNGFLIKNPENSDEIAELIQEAIDYPKFRHSGITYNNKNVKPKLNRSIIREEVINKYQLVEKTIAI